MANELSREEALALEKQLRTLLTKVTEDKLGNYQPYGLQKQFHLAGRHKAQRLFQLPNQAGKTEAGAMEVAMHASGRYFPGWQGRRWTKPTRGWVAGDSAESVRENITMKLLGTTTPFAIPEAVGTGALPKDTILKVIPNRGYGEMFDTILVKHVSGGVSTIKSKMYTQERGMWQGPTLDYIWFDEEPPVELYVEGLARVTMTGGMTFTTFTPLKGMSSVVSLFHNDPGPDRALIFGGGEQIEIWKPTPAAKIEELKARYPRHEWRARIYGLAALGEGAVWPYDVDLLTTPPVPIGRDWCLICGIDFGVNENHPFAAAWVAWDKDTDIAYLYRTYRQAEAPISTHAAVLRGAGEGIPVSWPHDGHQREKGSMESVAAQFKRAPNSVNMLPVHAQWPEGGFSHEAFVTALATRIETGRFKVFNTEQRFFEEYNAYHRENGMIVKRKDDLISAVKCAIMMLRYARPVSKLGARRMNTSSVAADVEFKLI